MKMEQSVGKTPVSILKMTSERLEYSNYNFCRAVTANKREEQTANYIKNVLKRDKKTTKLKKYSKKLSLL